MSSSKGWNISGYASASEYISAADLINRILRASMSTLCCSTSCSSTLASSDSSSRRLGKSALRTTHLAASLDRNLRPLRRSLPADSCISPSGKDPGIGEIFMLMGPRIMKAMAKKLRTSGIIRFEYDSYWNGADSRCKHLRRSEPPND
jgi:hypothetical protein